MGRETDLAWLAGFFEGEGSINLHRSGNGWGGILTLSQQNKQLIENVVVLVQELGLPKPRIQEPVAYEHSQNNCWSLCWNCNKGSLFLESVRCYFRHPYKIARADIYLKFYDVNRVNAKDRVKEKQLLFEEFRQQQRLEKDERSKQLGRMFE